VKIELDDRQACSDCGLNLICFKVSIRAQLDGLVSKRIEYD
jgi:hypothetical protein